MFRKSLVPSVLFLGITMLSAMTSAVHAQEVEVPFDGSVKAACEFLTPVGGTLAPNNAILPTQLSSTNTGGTAGSVGIKCNTSATVAAKDYTQTAGPKFKVAKATYTVTNGAETDSKVKVGMGETSIGVNLTLDSDAPIPAGDYSYNVMVTAAP